MGVSKPTFKVSVINLTCLTTTTAKTKYIKRKKIMPDFVTNKNVSPKKLRLFIDV